MKIGLVTTENKHQPWLRECDEVVELETLKPSSSQFYQLVQTYAAHDLYIESISDIGLQFVQLAEGFSFLKDQGKIIHFIDKGFLQHSNDELYFNIIAEFAENEKRISNTRVRKGVAKALKEGTPYGRPSLDEKTIEGIKYLRHREYRSIREIAAIYNVSVGVVHKYVAREKPVRNGQAVNEN